MFKHVSDEHDFAFICQRLKWTIIFMIRADFQQGMVSVS